MAVVKKTGSVFIPKGFKQVDGRMPFIRLKNMGDSFQGVFIRTSKIPAHGKFNEQITWICESTADDGEVSVKKGTKPVKVKKGEIYQIGEKTVMAGFTERLTPGEEFVIICTGQKESSTGSKYDDFDFFMKEV